MNFRLCVVDSGLVRLFWFGNDAFWSLVTSLLVLVWHCALFSLVFWILWCCGAVSAAFWVLLALSVGGLGVELLLVVLVALGGFGFA